MLKLNSKRRGLLHRLFLSRKSGNKTETKLIQSVGEINKGVLSKRLPRREMLYNIGLATTALTVGTIIGACDDDESTAQQPNMDPQILNFALNLEYLEAEYYLRAIGQQLSNADRGAGAGTVTGGSQVPFTAGSLIEQYANEIAADELAHVRFLRSALGSAAVSSPDLNFTDAFAALGFDPFANELNFLLGAFVFEDVGVTAYNGAAPLITDPTILAAAASILAVEAYHAGEIRVVLFALGQDDPDLIATASAISNARDGVDDDVDNDQPITQGGNANVVPTDANGLAFARTTDAVLNIVYLNPDGNPGGFFPNGFNGDIA